MKLKVFQPAHVLLSSDYSSQEPKLTAALSGDETMIKSFQEGKDIYATIASISFKVPYEQCLEFHPDTHEYQPEGKARRKEAKTILLGILYGRSIPSIAEQLYGTRDDMDDDLKTKEAQKVYDSVMNGFPGLRNFMLSSQEFARVYGYVETILGRRRHLPDMQLPDFEFRPLSGYVNPDIDPLDPSTLDNQEDIPQRVVSQLESEFSKFKYFGQIVKRTKQLQEEHIRVINNRAKIQDATRQCVNSRVQGSAADMTKMALLLIESSDEWRRIGGKVLVPVHDEIIAEVPAEFAEEGSQLLSELMCKAAEFLPFDMKCDVETTYRWYGLEAPCPYPKPTSLQTTDPDEVCWIQYMLVENEYILPIITDDSGEARGNAAHGVNGQRSPEMDTAIDDYCKHWNIATPQFLDHIEKHVICGV